MYDDLNYCLDSVDNEYEFSSNEWHSYVKADTVEALGNFDENDWKKLFEEIPQKSIRWKKYFAECLSDLKDENQFKVFLYLLAIDDNELLALLITQLLKNHFNEIGIILEKIDNSSELIERVKNAMPLVSDGYRNNFKLFLQNSGYDSEQISM